MKPINETLRGLALLSLLSGALCSVAATGHAQHGSATKVAEQAPTIQINLNTASESELMALPGIGQSKARAILKLRERVKRFKRLEDLLRVKGIGRKTFRKLRPMLKLEGESVLGSVKKGR